MNPAATPRNPWPFALIGFFAVFITFMAVFIGFAVRQRTDLVRADYYEDEILYQRQIDRLNRTHPLRSGVAIAYDPATQRIRLALPVSGSQKHVTGRIHLYRPSNAGLDREFELAIKADGSQTVETKNLSEGLWKIRLTWQSNGEEYFFDQSLVISSQEFRRRP